MNRGTLLTVTAELAWAIACALSASLLMLVLVKGAGFQTLPCQPHGVDLGVLHLWMDWMGELLFQTRSARDWSCAPLMSQVKPCLHTLGLVMLTISLSLGVALIWAWNKMRANTGGNHGDGWSAVLLAPPVLWAAVLTVCVNLCVVILSVLLHFDPMGLLFPDPHYVLKVVTAVLALTLGGGTLQELRAQVEQQMSVLLQSDYIMVTQVNGLPIGGALFRGLITPTLMSAAARVPLLLGEVIVVEYVFVMDGIGRGVVNMVELRDGASLMFVTLVLVGATTLTRSLARFVDIWLNPRIKSEVQ